MCLPISLLRHHLRYFRREVLHSIASVAFLPRRCRLNYRLNALLGLRNCGVRKSIVPIASFRSRVVSTFSNNPSRTFGRSSPVRVKLALRVSVTLNVAERSEAIRPRICFFSATTPPQCCTECCTGASGPDRGPFASRRGSRLHRIGNHFRRAAGEPRRPPARHQPPAFFFCLGDYYTSRVRAEPAFGALRSRTRTTHWWQPPALCVPLQEGQKWGSRSTPTTPRAYLCSVEGPSMPAEAVASSLVWLHSAGVS